MNPMKQMAVAAIVLCSSAFTTEGMSPAAAVSVRVETVDLDLSTPEGQAKLESRIKGAVKSVCRAADHSLRERNVTLQCEADALKSIQKDVEVALARVGGAIAS